MADGTILEGILFLAEGTTGGIYIFVYCVLENICGSELNWIHVIMIHIKIKFTKSRTDCTLHFCYMDSNGLYHTKKYSPYKIVTPQTVR
jgi:hypothetical protein